MSEPLEKSYGLYITSSGLVAALRTHQNIALRDEAFSVPELCLVARRHCCRVHLCDADVRTNRHSGDGNHSDRPGSHGPPVLTQPFSEEIRHRRWPRRQRLARQIVGNVLRQMRRGAVAVVRIMRQAFEQQRFELFVDLAFCCAWPPRFLLCYPPHDVLTAPRLVVGKGPRKQTVKNHAKAVNVASCIQLIALPGRLFGRHECCRAGDLFSHGGRQPHLVRAR